MQFKKYGAYISCAPKEVRKSAWRMPRLSEAKKDVISCEKLWGVANRP